MRSAGDIDDVGWPELAAVVHLMLSTRNWAPSSELRVNKSSISTILPYRKPRGRGSSMLTGGELIKGFTFYASMARSMHSYVTNARRSRCTTNEINKRRAGAAARSPFFVSESKSAGD